MRMHAARFTFALAVALAAAAPFTGRGQETPAPTFTETIAPIVYGNCVKCHRPGEAAPFPLISYEDVAKRATLIEKVTRSRYMPPWRAEPGHGDFADARRLSDDQIATIGRWVRAGLPRGNPAKLPPVPQFAEGWQLGKPDLVLEMPEGYSVPASGPDVYRNFAIPTGLAEDKWVSAVELRPAARKAVHHAIISYVRGGAATELDARSPEPGFGGAMLAALVPGFQPAGELGGWAVGTTPRFFPAGVSRPLAKGSDLVLQIHFHPTGKTELERAQVGLYFAPSAPERRLFTPGIPGLFGFLAGIDIPPGEKHYTINGSYTVPIDVQLLSVMAHAHYLGKDIKADATLPDGTTKPLLWIRDWDFNWQDRYDYKEPVFLPKGTRIDATISYDNSADNPRNPCNPPRRVTWGVQSFDEMGSVNFMMVAISKTDEESARQQGGAMLKAALSKLAQSDAVKRYLAQRERYLEDVARAGGDPCAAEIR